MEQVEISEDSIHNLSNMPLWFWIDGKKVVINPVEKH
jgi:hypothetical protein